MLQQKNYQYEDISLFQIRNRNETRVIALLPEILNHFPEYKPEMLDVQDIYALALNKLKPRYTQGCTLVLNEPVTDDIIRKKIEQAVRRVRKYPNHG